MAHGIDPQAVAENKYTAKDVAKSQSKTEVLHFLRRVHSMEGVFPLQEISPINLYAINGDSDGLIKYMKAEHQSSDSDANQEVYNLCFFYID